MQRHDLLSGFHCDHHLKDVELKADFISICAGKEADWTLTRFDHDKWTVLTVPFPFSAGSIVHIFCISSADNHVCAGKEEIEFSNHDKPVYHTRGQEFRAFFWEGGESLLDREFMSGMLGHGLIHSPLSYEA